MRNLLPLIVFIIATAGMWFAYRQGVKAGREQMRNEMSDREM